jgi:hypothetical protein
MGKDTAVSITKRDHTVAEATEGFISMSRTRPVDTSTWISNSKSSGSLVVVASALPQPTDEAIKVELLQPALADVAQIPAGRGGTHDLSILLKKASTALPNRPHIAISKVSNVLYWAFWLGPREKISVPFKYMIVWPNRREIRVTEEVIGM